MEDQIKVTFGDVEITYIEGANAWEFDLRGRHRSAPSLLKAKEFISKVPASKRKPFDRFDAILMGHWGADFQKCVVTSIADRDYSGNLEYWISRKVPGNAWKPAHDIREKAAGSKLISVTHENETAIAKVKRMSHQRDGIDREIESLKASLERVLPPSGTDIGVEKEDI